MSSKQQEQLPDLTQCGECSRPPKKGETLKTCSGCGLVAYCCTACQTKAWNGHRAACKRARKEREAKAKEAAKEPGSGNRSGSGLGDMGSIMAALMPPPQQPLRYNEIHIFNACFQGHHEELQRIMRQSKLNVNWAEPDTGATAAYAAAQTGHARCLSLLIQHNADLSKANKQGAAPIHKACEYGRDACLEVLLDNGVDADQPTADGSTPLIIACANGHVKCMALLLDRSADPDLANSYGFTAAHRACQDGHLKCLQLLVMRGAALNNKDRYG
jgi:hypothetical protein